MHREGRRTADTSLSLLSHGIDHEVLCGNRSEMCRTDHLWINPNEFVDFGHLGA